MTSKKKPQAKIIHTLQIPLTEEGRRLFLGILRLAECGSYSGLGGSVYADERAMIDSLRSELGAYCSKCGQLKPEEES